MLFNNLFNINSKIKNFFIYILLNNKKFHFKIINIINFILNFI